MNQTSFQNGFICGMATKGLVRSGELYKPLIWNESGVYTFFYIDFRYVVLPFSLGMWNESIVVHDDEQLNITKVEKVTGTLYKAYCNIADKIHGITVLNKATSRLHFSSTGERVPVFSVHTFISGIPSYDSTTYLYEKEDLFSCSNNSAEAAGTSLWNAINAGVIAESTVFELPMATATQTEAATIVLT